MTMRLPWIALLAMVVAGCGLREPLRPAEGKALPAAPPMAREALTPDELLAVPTEFRPRRVDEILTRSEPRQADPFDLPPATLEGEESESELEPRPDTETEPQL
jgi:hypothetical protein